MRLGQLVLAGRDVGSQLFHKSIGLGELSTNVAVGNLGVVAVFDDLFVRLPEVLVLFLSLAELLLQGRVRVEELRDMHRVSFELHGVRVHSSSSHT